MSTISPTAAPANSIYPLSSFYERAKLPPPRLEIIPGDSVPEPYRSLLVHHNDMTPKIGRAHV